MFTTHPSFKDARQFSGQMTTWRSVILDLAMPWYVVEVSSEESGITHETSVLVGSSEDLLQFIENEPLGAVVGASVAAPPNWSSSGEWEFIRLARVERRRKPKGQFPGELALTRMDGVRIDGRGLLPSQEDSELLVTLAEFDAAGVRAQDSTQALAG